MCLTYTLFNDILFIKSSRKTLQIFLKTPNSGHKMCEKTMCNMWSCVFYASAFRRRRHYVFGLSVRHGPKPEIPSFDRYMGPLVHPTNRNRFTACPSVRPERFPGICRRIHGGIGLKFYMLMYLDHVQNWLIYGHDLLIFLILALFWLSETGQIWGFRAFPGERMEGVAWNFACWCILTTFRTD